MNRTVISAITLGALLVAACGGGSESSDEPTVLSVATSTPSTTASTVPQTTAISAPTTPTASASVTGDSTPGATPNVATPTAPATTASATQAPTSNAPPPPTPTAATSSGNPNSAFVGTSGGGVRYFWSPAKVTIAPGGTVTWAWDEPKQPHNVVGIDFSFGPTSIVKQDSVSFTFATPGVYHFLCEVHDGMNGTVTVQ